MWWVEDKDDKMEHSSGYIEESGMEEAKELLTVRKKARYSMDDWMHLRKERYFLGKWVLE